MEEMNDKELLELAEQQEPVLIVEQLWQIIDDIDTYSDVAKSDDKAFRALVEKRQADRWKTGITTDGYSLNIPQTPAAKEWQGLTRQEISKASAVAQVDFCLDKQPKYEVALARAIEAKLKEKNT